MTTAAAEAPVVEEAAKPDVKAILARWHTWTSAGLATAHRLSTEGDAFGAELVLTRRDVRLRATRMLESTADVAECARRMHRHAIDLHVPASSPLIGFDPVALQYTNARTWQACAWELDPSLPEVQRRWD